MPPTTVSDHFPIFADFEELLDSAEEQAKTPKEMEFVASVRARSDNYAGRAYLSHAQARWLRDIGNRGCGADDPAR